MKRTKKTIVPLLCALTLVSFMTSCTNVNNDNQPQTVIVDATKPIIVTEPQDLNLRVDEETTGLQVVAYTDDDGSLSYQWYSNSIDSNEGGNKINGATSNILKIDTKTASSTYYYCKITNSNLNATGKKEASVNSDSVLVNIVYEIETPRIIREPKSTSYVFKAQESALPLEVEASVSRGELSYQRYKSLLGTYDDGIKIEGATTNTYTPDISKTGVTNYYCEITNTDMKATEGNTVSVNTKIVTISVDFEYDSFEFQSIDETSCKLVAYKGSSFKVVVPDTDKEGRKVVEIGPSVFANSNIVEVTIPDTVVKLGYYNSDSHYGEEIDGVFSNCSALKEVYFNGHFKYLGDFAFNKCVALETDIWKYCDQLETMCRGVFQNVTLRSELIFPETFIGEVMNYNFQHAKGIKTIKFAGDKVTRISGSAFADISTLENVVFPASITSVGDCLKQNPGLKEVTFERSAYEHMSITNGNPFGSGETFDNLLIHVPLDSYQDYCDSLGEYQKYIVAPEGDEEFIATIVGASINGESSFKIKVGETLPFDGNVVYDKENNYGWLCQGKYYSDYKDLVSEFKMSYHNETIKVLYDEDYSIGFTPCCDVENIKVSSERYNMNHEKIGEYTATRYKMDKKIDLKITNGDRETHHGVNNDSPVYSTGKSSLLMTFVNNSEDIIKFTYEVEYFGVIGSVTVQLNAKETKTELIVVNKARDNNARPYHQLKIVEGGDNGYDISIYGRKAI